MLAAAAAVRAGDSLYPRWDLLACDLLSRARSDILASPCTRILKCSPFMAARARARSMNRLITSQRDRAKRQRLRGG